MTRLDRIVAAIQRVLPESFDGIALHEPVFEGNEHAYVKESLDSGWVSSGGAFVDRFEKDLADFVGVRQAVACVNGTAALHVCLLLCGVDRDDEVIIPSLTFVATANAVAYCSAVPHLADSNADTLGLDPAKLDAHLREVAQVRGESCWNRVTGRRIAAVLPMHTFGHPVDLDPLIEVCERFRLTLIEDAAESLGSYYKGKHTGVFGRMSSLSFNGNKIVTTGGGGAIITNDQELGRLAKHLTTTAKLPHRWCFNHDQVGFNYRMPNLNAALGCAQLERLPDFLVSKRKLAAEYRRALEGIEGVRFVSEPHFARSNYWLNAILIERGSSQDRDDLLGRMNDLGILARPTWTPMHQLPMYSNCPRMDLSVAERIAATLVNLPSSAVLGARLLSQASAGAENFA